MSFRFVFDEVRCRNLCGNRPVAERSRCKSVWKMPKSERIGFEWLDLCQKTNCEVVQAPANTSRFLQPCDQFVNKAFQGAASDVRDKVNSMAIVNTKSVQIKLMCESSDSIGFALKTSESHSK